MSGAPLPAAQATDSVLLAPDGIVYLYQMTPIGSGPISFKADNSLTWQGTIYQGTAVQIDQRERNSDGTLSRPKLTIANPLAVYSALVAAGSLENATLVEYKVLYQHILSNTNIFQQRTWKVRRCTALNRVSVTFELRDTLDGQKFIMPGRMYVPPEFPSVSL